MSVIDCLVTAKRLIADGDAARHRCDDPSRRQAVIIYDVAVEDALLAIATHVGRSGSAGANRPEMCELLADVIPSHAQAARIRSEIRNKAMHRGATPTDGEVEQAHAMAECVLRDAFRAAGHDYDACSFVPLIANALIREPLCAAEASGDAHTALGSVMQAWRALRGVVQEAIASAQGTDLWFFRNALWESNLLMSKCHDNRAEHVLEALELACSQVLCADSASALRLAQLCSRISLTPDESGEVREPVERADALWAIDFVACTTYYLERANPNLRQAVMAPRSTGRAEVLPVVVVPRSR